MNMEKQWRELKTFLRNKSGTGFDYLDALKKMEEIERRDLPERVAELLKGLDVKFWLLDAHGHDCDNDTLNAVQELRALTAHILLTGDPQELERYQK